MIETDKIAIALHDIYKPNDKNCSFLSCDFIAARDVVKPMLEQLQCELDKAKKENGQLCKLPRNILQIQKLWASTINPDYKKMAESMITIAEQALKEVEQSMCTWTLHEPFYGEEAWGTSCGAEWMLTEGGLKDNGVVFCHKCGKLVKEVRPDKEND